MSDGEYLTIDQVAERLHIGKSTVWVLIRDEGLPSVKVGKRRLVRAKDLDEWAERKVERSGDDPR